MLYRINRNGIAAGVGQISSPNCDDRPTATSIDTLVIHGISLPPGEFGGAHIADLFTNRLQPEQHPYFAQICAHKVSSHFVIDRAGKITQFVPTIQRAWHAGRSAFRGRQRVNDFSIGIELEGCDSQAFEAVQYQQLVNLTASIRRANPAITSDRIIGHSDIAPGRKTDPWACFDWRRFRAAL